VVDLLSVASAKDSWMSHSMGVAFDKSSGMTVSLGTLKGQLEFVN
jgi:hypothetical protein